MALRNCPDPYVRGSVLRFISELYPESTSLLLIEVLQDPHYIVRESAIDKLDELDVVESIPYIRPLLADPHLDTRQAAATAMQNLEERVIDGIEDND